MIKERVRGWLIKYDVDLFITYPDSGYGHQLICCQNCGHVYSVDIYKKLYSELEIDERLEDISCINCNESLAYHWFFYPDNYIDKDGTWKKYERSNTYPSQEDSVVREFNAIY